MLIINLTRRLDRCGLKCEILLICFQPFRKGWKQMQTCSYCSGWALKAKTLQPCKQPLRDKLERCNSNSFSRCAHYLIQRRARYITKSYSWWVKMALPRVLLSAHLHCADVPQDIVMSNICNPSHQRVTLLCQLALNVLNRILAVFFFKASLRKTLVGRFPHRHVKHIAWICETCRQMCLIVYSC